MKKIALLVIGLFIFCTSAWADITAHPNYQNILARKNIIIGLIKGQQAIHLAQHGHYFQGILIPSQIACNGSTDVGVDYGLHPDDQSDSWGSWLPDVFNDDFRTLFNIQVNVMTRLQEQGYTINLSLVREGLGTDPYGNTGSIWRYTYVYGPIGVEGIINDWYVTEPIPEP